MTAITSRERLYFGAVGLLALWVGVWGFLSPSHVGRALPFVVPPLHARFLGAMYLSGLAFMVGAILAQRWAEVRVVPFVTAAWTGGLLVVSLLHLEEFNLAEPQDQVWFAAYAVYPLIALWLSWCHRGRDNRETVPGARLPGWVRTYLIAQAVATTSLGLALFILPGPMVDVWPWPITSLLAQLYSAPMLAYGIGSVLLARQQTWPEVRVCLIAMFIFASAVLVGSLLHTRLFRVEDPATWVWFCAFALASGVLGRVGWAALRMSEPEVSV